MADSIPPGYASVTFSGKSPVRLNGERWSPDIVRVDGEPIRYHPHKTCRVMPADVAEKYVGKEDFDVKFGVEAQAPKKKGGKKKAAKKPEPVEEIPVEEDGDSSDDAPVLGLDLS